MCITFSFLFKVNEAEKERIESEQYHEKTTKVFKEAEESVQQLQKELKRSISKSKYAENLSHIT